MQQGMIVILFWVIISKQEEDIDFKKWPKVIFGDPKDNFQRCGEKKICQPSFLLIHFLTVNNEVLFC